MHAHRRGRLIWLAVGGSLTLGAHAECVRRLDVTPVGVDAPDGVVLALKSVRTCTDGKIDSHDHFLRVQGTHYDLVAGRASAERLESVNYRAEPPTLDAQQRLYWNGVPYVLGITAEHDAFEARWENPYGGYLTRVRCKAGEAPMPDCHGLAERTTALLPEGDEEPAAATDAEQSSRDVDQPGASGTSAKTPPGNAPRQQPGAGPRVDAAAGDDPDNAAVGDEDAYRD